MTNTVRIGMLGCGVVGGGVVEALHRNADYMAKQFGFRFELVRVVVRDISRPRTPHFQSDWIATDWRKVTEAEDIDIVIEAIGGTYPAKQAIESALRHGKHVVTANKELLATFGRELAQLAKDCKRQLLFEASVLGGIPALHALQTYFAANRITRMRGIVNGTTNFILTRMAEAESGFAQALAEAQAAGYAEADPTADVEGYDASYKLQILIRQAFAAEIAGSEIERRGIVGIEAEDIQIARALGCKLKLVAETVKLESGTALTAAVRPVLLGSKDPLYHVDGVQNALCVTGDLVGDLVFMGPGAGAFPTASAVVEDLVKVALAAFDWRSPSTGLELLPLASRVYVLRRRCLRDAFVGAQYGAVLAEALNAEAVEYVPGQQDGAEAWVVILREASTSEALLTQANALLKGALACYPIQGWPAVLEWVPPSVVAAG